MNPAPSRKRLATNLFPLRLAFALRRRRRRCAARPGGPVAEAFASPTFTRSLTTGAAWPTTAAIRIAHVALHFLKHLAHVLHSLLQIRQALLNVWHAARHPRHSHSTHSGHAASARRHHSRRRLAWLARKISRRGARREAVGRGRSRWRARCIIAAARRNRPAAATNIAPAAAKSLFQLLKSAHGLFQVLPRLLGRHARTLQFCLQLLAIIAVGPAVGGRRVFPLGPASVSVTAARRIVGPTGAECQHCHT